VLLGTILDILWETHWFNIYIYSWQLTAVCPRWINRTVIVLTDIAVLVSFCINTTIYIYIHTQLGYCILLFWTRCWLAHTHTHYWWRHVLIWFMKLLLLLWWWRMECLYINIYIYIYMASAHPCRHNGANICRRLSIVDHRSASHIETTHTRITCLGDHTRAAAFSVELHGSVHTDKTVLYNNWRYMHTH